MNPRRQILQNLTWGVMLGLLAAGCVPTKDEGKGSKELLELVPAMDRRLQVAGDVAWAKHGSNSPVQDPVREATTLGRVAAWAEARGLDPASAREFVEAQIAASRKWQEDRLQRWRAGEPLPPGVPPDLATELRPRMDLTTQELLDTWAAWISVTGRTRFHAQEAKQMESHLKAAGYSEAAVRLACGTLMEIERKGLP